MTRALFAALVVTFAILVTTHVTIAVGLARRRLPWPALCALIVAPLAPWWGWRNGMKARVTLWIAAAAAYGASLGATLLAH